MDMAQRKIELLREPEDAEISCMLGGAKVISFRPEHLPAFDNSLGSYRGDKVDESLDFLITEIQRQFPQSKIKKKRLSGIFLSAEPRLLTIKSQDQKKIEYFILMRPNQVTNMRDRLSYLTGIDRKNFTRSVSRILPREAINFIQVYHEIEHMRQRLGISQTFAGTYNRELAADKSALLGFIKESRKRDVANAYISLRALSGFLLDPEEYWLAPALQQEFNDASHNFGSIFIDETVSLAYGELRLRTVHDVVSSDKLAMFSSEEIKEALLKFEMGDIFEIDNNSLRQAVMVSEEYRLREDSPYTDHKRIFSSLQNVSRLNNIDHETNICAEQILGAVRLFCPKLLP